MLLMASKNKYNINYVGGEHPTIPKITITDNDSALIAEIFADSYGQAIEQANKCMIKLLAA